MNRLYLHLPKMLALMLSGIFLILVSISTAQSQTISGTIKSATENEPLAGVTVHIKGQSRGTVTNTKGHYQLTNVLPNDTLMFSYIGYREISKVVGNQTRLDIILDPTASSLNQVVVIGYGTAKKKDLTGAVAQIDASTFKNQQMTQVTDMLTGTIAGVNTNQETSAAGGSSLEIRGRTSLNASNAPMIVVDGAIFTGSLADINPFDVESIDILKDASSAAVYGARASNGVILITTKKGKLGNPTINFSTEIGIAEVNNRDYKPFDAKQYLKFRADLLRGESPDKPFYYYSNPNDLPNDVTIEQWRNASNNSQSDNTKEWLSRLRLFPIEKANYLSGKTVNWFDKVMKHGLRQTYNLSIGGKSDKLSYYWSGGYVNNKGIILGDQFSTIRTRLNIEFKITNWLNAGINSEFSHRNRDVTQADLGDMFMASPYGSMYDSTGNLNWYPGGYLQSRNPLINYYGQERSNKTNSLFAAIYAKIDLPFEIEYKLSFQPHYHFGYDYNFWPSATTITGSQSHSNGYGTREETRQYEWILDNILHWDKKIGIHNFDLTLLYSAEKHLSWYTFLSNEQFAPNQNLGFHALQFGTNPSFSNNDTKTTGDALMARLNYSLLNKYLLTLSIRRDGYSAFGQKKPRAFFPAAAIAWRISDEDFFNINWIDQMKLRLSWGVNGNRDIGAYAALAQVSPNLYYDGSNTVVGIYNNTLSNPNLSWERTEAYNIGFDATLFKNRIAVSANYYLMRTTDLLMKRTLPAITGFNSVTTNLGEVDNHGFELTLNTVNVTKPKFSWKTHFVFSLNRNEIKHLFGDYKEVTKDGKTVKEEVPDYTNEWFPGQAIDRVWNYKIIGIWQVDEASEAAVYHEVPGDIKAQDINQDSSYQALDDKQFIGYTQPQYRFGLRNEFTIFNNLSISLFIRADLGQIGAFSDALHRGFSTYDRRNTAAIPYWTPSNPINDYPRLTVNETPFGGGIMVYKPRWFVRIQDFTISYNINQQVLHRIGLRNLRVFGAVRNLYTFDKWPGWDPESGNSPMPKIYTVGFALSL